MVRASCLRIDLLAPRRSCSTMLANACAAGSPRGRLQVTNFPITPVFGALIQGADVGSLRAAQRKQLYELCQHQHVVVLRGAAPARESFERYASEAGEIDSMADQEAAETPWNAELAGAERPPLVCMLRAIDVTANAGGTWFANLPAALRSMPADLVARLRWLAIEHGPAVHPMVIMQPETGELSLFLGLRHGARIVGLPLAESERLLNIVWSYATADSVTLFHRWQPGDVVLWNNLTALHRHEPLPAGGIRRLQHVRYKGRYTLAAPIQKEAA